MAAGHPFAGCRADNSQQDSLSTRSHFVLKGRSLPPVFCGRTIAKYFVKLFFLEGDIVTDMTESHLPV